MASDNAYSRKNPECYLIVLLILLQAKAREPSHTDPHSAETELRHCRRKLGADLRRRRQGAKLTYRVAYKIPVRA